MYGNSIQQFIKVMLSY